MKLTVEQQQALEQGGAVEVTVDGKQCVLMPSKLFDQLTVLLQLKRLVESDNPTWTQQEKLALLQAFGQKAGWIDPELDLYERYRP